MTTEEFSNQFDVLYNNATSNQAPGLDEYEKSVFLTKAQNELVKNHFSKNSKGNTLGEGYDESAKRQADFSMLMRTTLLSPKTGNFTKFDPRSLVFEWPEDVFVVISENVTFSTNNTTPIRRIVSLTYDEYDRLMSKPYKQPLKNQAWRLITGTDTYPVVEVIITNTDYNKYPARYYKLRYVKKPQPIVLVDLSNYSTEQLSIEGVSVKTECELNPIMHEELLQRAVELAKIAWVSTDANGLNAELTAGQRSE